MKKDWLDKKRVSFCFLLFILFFPIIAGAVSPIQASFSFRPIRGDAPLTVYFSGTSNANIESWIWEFGDGTSLDQMKPSHNYTRPGSYRVKLTVSNKEGSYTAYSKQLITVYGKGNQSYMALPENSNIENNLWFESVF